MGARTNYEQFEGSRVYKLDILGLDLNLLYHTMLQNVPIKTKT